MREFFDPMQETQNIVLVNADTVHKAEKLLVGCESCSPEAELPFDNMIDFVTGNKPCTTDYIFVEAMATCPQCGRPINEKTLVEVSADCEI